MLRTARRTARRLPPPAPAADPARDAEVHDALARLTPLDRALVWGQVVEGLSYRELAAIHGRPETALRSRCCRAKQRLAAWLGDGTKEEGGSR